jgi:hypothetical protein
MADLATDWLTAHGGIFRSAAKTHRHRPHAAAADLARALSRDAAAAASAKAEHARCADVLQARGGPGRVCCVITEERHRLLDAALKQIEVAR